MDKLQRWVNIFIKKIDPMAGFVHIWPKVGSFFSVCIHTVLMLILWWKTPACARHQCVKLLLEMCYGSCSDAHLITCSLTHYVGGDEPRQFS